MHNIHLGWHITQDGQFNHLRNEMFPIGDLPGFDGHSEMAFSDYSSLAIGASPCDLTNVFVLWRLVRHRDSNFDEPKEIGKVVRAFIHKHDPDAVVIWGIIDELFA